VKRIRTALVGVVAAACMVTGTLSANADPDAVAEAKSELARIQQESSALDQQIIEAFDAADKATAKLKTLKADLKAQEAKVDAGITELGDAAALQMGNDSVSLAAQLLTTSDSANFLSGLSAMQAEVDRSSAGVQQLQLEQAKLETLRTEAADTKAEADKQAKAKESLKADYDEKEAEAQAIYDRLSAEEQQRLADLQAEEEAAATAAAEASAARSASASRGEDRSETASSSSSSDSTSTAAGSGRASSAVSAALSKVGSSYVFGSTGPSSFDCSGLMYWAYSQAGISLPRSSGAQYSGAGSRVSISDLKPGDLVFYYSPISHVGMYIGGGRIVHAANPRSGVTVAGLRSMPISGAVRVVG